MQRRRLRTRASARLAAAAGLVWAAAHGVAEPRTSPETPPRDDDPAGELREQPSVVEVIEVVAVTPVRSSTVRRDRLARSVQTVTAEDLQGAAVGLAGHLERKLAGVSLDSAQHNPLQPDLHYRGYTASPLLGLPQGIAVYQNGARLNEPLGDAVNWDLIPTSAIQTATLSGGADPLFGLNALGGALVLSMKNGFDFTGHEATVSGGSFGRLRWGIESGGNQGRLGYYVNLEHFEEDGWRDLSPSEADNRFVSLSHRGEHLRLDLTLHDAHSHLTGNGAAPVGLLDRDRDAIFTAPDVTANDMTMLTLEGAASLTDTLTVTASGYRRANRTRSLNGDLSEFRVCNFTTGDRLLEGLDEDALETGGLEADALCTDARFTDLDALEAFLESATGEPAEIDDLTPTLSGSGALADEAIDNRSRRDQEAWGLDLAIDARPELAGRHHQFLAGVRILEGQSDFEAVVELAHLDPVTRSTRGLGVGTFVDAEATAVSTRNESRGVYAQALIALSTALDLSLSARYDRTTVTLRDRSGAQPELDGHHEFDRLDPAIGLTWQPLASLTLYASYGASSRAPTPIELACNEAVFAEARRLAAAAGEDADGVDAECRLPNAFVADPPLPLVVARNLELGARGQPTPALRWSLAAFHTVNEDDIIFQSTGRATGLFAPVDRTRRRGVDLLIEGRHAALRWFTNFSWLEATYEDTFSAASPAHPAAEDGLIAVADGDRIPGAPAYRAKLGGDLELPWNVSVGGEVLYSTGDHLRGDEINALARLDGYWVLNLRGAVRWNEQVELFARIDNVLDAAYENFGVLGEDPAEVVPTLQDTRPIYLSPGAPRAAWLGLRLRL